MAILPRSTTQRWLMVSVLAALTAMIVALLAPISAQGVTATQWQQDLGSAEGTVLLDYDSGVVAQLPYTGAAQPETLYRRFGADGTEAASVAGNTASFVASATDASGDLYEAENVFDNASSTFAPEVRLRATSGVVWHTALPSADNGARHLLIGNDRVYVSVLDRTGSTLYTLRASDGSLLQTTALPASLDVMSLVAFSGGLVGLSGGDHVAYFDSEGQLTTQIAPATDTVLRATTLAVTATGRAYALSSAADDTSGEPTSVTALDAGQGAAWTKLLPDYMAHLSPYQYHLAATADGGVVASADAASGSPWGTGPVVTKFAADGANSWIKPVTLDGALANGTVADLHGVSGGDVVVSTSSTGACDAAADCNRLTLSTYDQATGSVLGVIAELDSASQNGGYGYGQSTVTNGRLYLLTNFVAANSYDRHTKLVGADAPGLGTSYPEGAVRDTVHVGGSGGGSGSPSPTPTPTSKCPSLQIIGVRGSRANTADTSDTDGVLLAVKSKISTKLAGTSFQAIKYPAIPVLYTGASYGSNYQLSVNQGKNALRSYLRAFLNRCSHTPVALIGYSQGAHVAGDEYGSLTDSQRRRTVLLMFGDPRFNRAQPAVDDGDYNKRLWGIYQLFDSKMRLVPGPATSNARSYCTNGDPVCNFSSSNIRGCAKVAVCPHVHYIDRGWTDLGALWVVKRFKALPAA